MLIKCKKFPIQRIKIYLPTINKRYSIQNVQLKLIVYPATDTDNGILMQSHYAMTWLYSLY